MSQESRYHSIFDSAIRSATDVLKEQSHKRENDVDIQRRQEEVKGLENMLEQNVAELIASRPISSVEDIEQLCIDIDRSRDDLAGSFVKAHRTSLPQETVSGLWRDFVRQSIHIRRTAKDKLLEELRVALLEEEEQKRAEAVRGERSALEEQHARDLAQISELQALLEIAERESNELRQTNERLAEETADKDRRIAELQTALSERERATHQREEEVRESGQDLLEKRSLLENRIEQIYTRLKIFDKREADILQWQFKLGDLTGRVLLAEKEEAEAGVRIGVDGSQKRVDTLGRQIKTLEKWLSDLEKSKEYRSILQGRETLLSDLQRLQEVVRGIDTATRPIDNAAVDLVLVKDIPDINLPDPDTLFSEEDEFRAEEPGIIESKENKGRVAGLQFTVEFSAEDQERVVHFEEQIKAFLDMEDGLLRERLPFTPSEGGSLDRQEYERIQYELLLSGIVHPSYIDSISFATVVLGALRDKDGEFSARVQNQVSTSILKKEVGLAEGLKEAAKKTSRVYAQLAILGKIRPDLQIILKRNVGSKHGYANDLTPLGKMASQVWTKKLLDEGVVTIEQLNLLHTNILERAALTARMSAPKGKKKKDIE